MDLEFLTEKFSEWNVVWLYPLLVARSIRRSKSHKQPEQINRRQTGVIVKLSHLKWEDGGEVMTLRRDIPPHS